MISSRDIYRSTVFVSCKSFYTYFVILTINQQNKQGVYYVKFQPFTGTKGDSKEGP
jgi:hypothetical protein